ncbi:MAG TPA: GreA/GreB family elongation factor [Longimicrobiaceae bacterium]
MRERLGTELERLSRRLTDDMEAEFAGTGRATPEERRKVQARIRRLGQLVAGLPRLECGTLAADRVGFGSTVVLQDLDTGQRVSYTLVTGDVIDLEEDQVSLASPVGQALLGCRVGDRISVDAPAGKLRYRLIAMTTLPQMLGLEPACA